MSVTRLPTISIVMPVRNRADTLEKAIRSVIEQDYPHTEFIILDGGSTDGSVDIIQRYAKHISYWQSGPDGGAAIVTNAGIEKATGDLVAIFMADDWFEPGTFQKIAEAWQDNPDADIFTCAGRIVRFDAATQLYQPLLTYTTAEEMALTFYNICFAVSAICSRFIRKSLYQRIGLFIPFDANGRIILANDKEFLIRAMLHGVKDVFIDHLGHTYLAHAESYSFANSRSSKLRHCREHMDIAVAYLKRKELTVNQRLFLFYWYHNQSAKLMLYQLLDRDVFAAMNVAKEGMARYNVLWPLIVGYEALRLGCKAVLRIPARSFFS